MVKRVQTAAEFQERLKAAFPQKRRVPRRQAESVLQKDLVKTLNSLGMGFYYRVRNGGQWDPNRKTFRKNAELVSVSDIVGWRETGRAVYIEVKRTTGDVEAKRKLIFSVQISEGQKSFLLAAHKAGCCSGIAFNTYDALSIAHDDSERFPRHPRTFLFLPKDELAAYAEDYKAIKARHSELNRDPVVNQVLWARGPIKP